MPTEEIGQGAPSTPTEQDACAASNTEPQNRSPLAEVLGRFRRPSVPHRPELPEPENDTKARDLDRKQRREAHEMLFQMNVPNAVKKAISGALNSTVALA